MNGEKQRKEWKKVKKQKRPGNDIVSANGMEDADASSFRECHQGEYKPPIVPSSGTDFHSGGLRGDLDLLRYLVNVPDLSPNLHDERTKDCMCVCGMNGLCLRKDGWEWKSGGLLVLCTTHHKATNSIKH